MDYSSSELHYVRIRGRVYGPYDYVRLKQMVSRGQLSRLHDISNDGQTWLSVSTHQELFDSSPVSSSPLVYSAKPNRPRAVADDESGNDKELRLADETEDDEEVGRGKAIWFVGGVDMTVGPVDIPRITSLIRRGELNANSLVWRKGLSDWVPMQDVSELSGLVHPEKPEKRSKRPVQRPQPERTIPDSSGPEVRDGRTGELIGELIYQASQPVPWITCIATTLGVLAMVLIVGGLIFLGQGVFSIQWARILVGAACVALSVTTQLAVFFLLRYRQRLLKCKTNASFLALVFAHQALSRLWLFAGIAIIVFAQIGLACFVWWILDRQGLIQFLSGL